MFESIMKLVRKVTKKEDQTLKSKDAAKERLHLVLMQDRANVSADFLDLMKQSTTAHKLMAHCMDGEKLYVNQLVQKHQSYLILIGPEGDFSPEELHIALQNGYKPVTLGNTRLRTETAALAACFEVNYINR